MRKLSLILSTALGSLGLIGVAAAAPLPAVAASSPVEFDVFLPLRNSAGLDALLARQQDTSSADYHKWLTPAQFSAQFGATEATKQAVAAELAQHGLAVTVQSRSLHVRGSAAAVNAMFSTTLARTRMPSGKLRTVSATPLVLTPALSAAGAFVPAFSSASPGMHVLSQHFKLTDPSNRYSTTGGYYYDDLKQAYGWPSYQTLTYPHGKSTLARLDGTGATIATLISSDVLDSDSDIIFDHENFSKTAGVPDPVLYARRAVLGGNAFSATSDDSFEASLDVQELLTGAPGAHVVLYNIPDLSDESILAGYTAIDEDNAVDAVSSSFGECELVYTAAYNNGVDQTSILKAYGELFKQGNSQGITFMASSGDEAGLECPQPQYFSGEKAKFIPGVSTPAADPSVTSVGGGNVVTTFKKGSLVSKYVDENAYDDPEIPYDIYGLGPNVSGGAWGAGGGVSQLFAAPAYQKYTNTGSTTARTLPDIGMQVGGCPGGIAKLPCDGGDTAKNGDGNTDRSYVIIALGGTLYGVIGTSVSSPEFTGALALLIEREGRQGNLNTYIYSLATKQAVFGTAAATVYHQGIPGYNGVVQNTKPGGYYNYTYGVGSPYVYRFIGLPSAKLAGTPQSASNP